MNARTAATGSFTVEQAGRRIIRELNRLADPAKARGAVRFFSQPVQALGIDAPTARRVAKEWSGRLKPAWDVREACRLTELLLRRPHLETRALGFLILAGFHKDFEPSLFDTAEGWLLTRLDNWALVDGFCGEVLARLVRRHPECAPGLRRWTQSNCLWVRRAAVVTLVPFARHGEQLDMAYEFAEALLGEREDLMHKAVGWLLREAGKTDPSRLRAFLLEHRGAIPRTTVRYAIERFPAQERKQLLAQTRQPVE